MTHALITGVTGQDGSYLAELLLSKGYDVYGLVRRGSREANVVPGVKVLSGDVTDLRSVLAAVEESDPDEVYNLAAQSYVTASFAAPESTAEINGLGAQNVFEAVAQLAPDARVYQAGTSEMFGGTGVVADESTPFYPRSPYACAKVYAHHVARNYRDRGLFVSNGILFNHESPRRSPHFVTRKIAIAAARIAAEGGRLRLGNIDAVRDWGFAGDYVEAMWRMLQADKPDDFVVATGNSYSVRDFCRIAFARVGLDWEAHVDTDPATEVRPTEVAVLRANPAKASRVLGWQSSTRFEGLAHMMVDAEVHT